MSHSSACAVLVFLNADAKGRNKHHPGMGTLPLPIMHCDSWSFHSLPSGVLSVGGASSASLAALHWFACSDHSSCQSLKWQSAFYQMQGLGNELTALGVYVCVCVDVTSSPHASVYSVRLIQTHSLILAVHRQSNLHVGQWQTKKIRRWWQFLWKYKTSS